MALPSGGLLIRNDSEIVLPPNQRKLLKIKTVTCMDFFFFLCLSNHIARRNINNLRYAEDNTLMAESEEELKRLLMSVKEESEKTGLKLNIQKTKIMAFGPITSWQIEWEKVEAVTDFIFLGSKITVDGDCSHEIKRHLLAPWKESYEKPRHHIKKQRHHFTDKSPCSQSYGFSSSHIWM